MSDSFANSNDQRSQLGVTKRPARRFRSRELVVAALVSIALLGSAFFFGLRWIEWNLTFHPVRSAAGESWVLPRGAEQTWLQTADGVRLNGWFFKSARQRSLATVIYFHGNSGNISDVGWFGEELRDRGFDVLLIDYRGYGRSEGEMVDEQGVYADADAAYRYVVEQREVHPDNVVLYGQSLGTTAAVDLASRKPCGALIIESGLSSATDMASNYLPWLPRWLHFLGRNRFDSARKLSLVSCPVLIAHGDPDPIIPTEQAGKLFAAAHEPRKLMLFPGAGHNVFGSQGDRYLDSITHFVREVVKAKKDGAGGRQFPHRPDTAKMRATSRP